MVIRDIAQGKLASNITPIARMGSPVRSAYSRAAEMIQTPSDDIGYAKGGFLLSGLTNALKSGLGFYGAAKDAQAEQAYYDSLAEQAKQEREDKLAQQQAEMDYKNNALAQQKELAQMNIDAANTRANTAREQALADREAQWAHEASVYNRNRADAMADQQAQLQAAIDAENRKQNNALALEEQKRQNAINDTIAKGLRPEEQQKYLNNPQNYYIKSRSILSPARWFGAKNSLIEREQTNFSNVSDEDLLKGL